MTNRESYDKVKFWVNEIRTHEPTCELILCGTKFDLIAEGSARSVDENTIKSYANSINAKYFETSSKTGHNVEQIFKTIAESIQSSEGTHGKKKEKTKKKTPEHQNTKTQKGKKKKKKKLQKSIKKIFLLQKIPCHPVTQLAHLHKTSVANKFCPILVYLS